MTIENAFEAFIEEKELALLSPESIKDYRWHVLALIRAVGADLELSALTYDLLKTKYLRPLLRRDDISRTTKSTYVRNVRFFLRWCNRNSLGLPFDASIIKSPKPDKKIVQVLTNEQTRLLFQSVEYSVPWVEDRNCAILALMLDSGLRQSEVCNLKRSDIDLSSTTLKVYGKGAKERLVATGATTRKMIGDYLRSCPFSDADALFVNRSGNALSKSAIRSVVFRLQKKTRLDLSSHKLRHNFATNFCVDNLRRTGSTNVADLQCLLGHSSIETTRKYEHFAYDAIAVEQSHSHLDMVYGVE